MLVLGISEGGCTMARAMVVAVDGRRGAGGGPSSTVPVLDGGTSGAGVGWENARRVAVIVIPMSAPVVAFGKTGGSWVLGVWLMSAVVEKLSNALLVNSAMRDKDVSAGGNLGIMMGEPLKCAPA